MYGHANAAGAEAVGAAAWYNTAEWGRRSGPSVPGVPRTFSSAGGVPVLFGTRAGACRSR